MTRYRPRSGSSKSSGTAPMPGTTCVQGEAGGQARAFSSRPGGGMPAGCSSVASLLCWLTSCPHGEDRGREAGQLIQPGAPLQGHQNGDGGPRESGSYTNRVAAPGATSEETAGGGGRQFFRGWGAWTGPGSAVRRGRDSDLHTRHPKSPRRPRTWRTDRTHPPTPRLPRTQLMTDLLPTLRTSTSRCDFEPKLDRARGEEPRSAGGA